MINNKEWLENLNKIFKQFKINPKEFSKYQIALTHSSYSHEQQLNYNNERYEFIGDAAISWVISNFLFLQDLNEGEMSIIKSKLVSGKVLTQAAKKIELDKLIIVGKGLEIISDKILENVFEAFIGAVTKDVGIKKAFEIIKYCIIEPFLKGEIETDKPYKTKIQEALMRSSGNDIKYLHTYDDNTKLHTVKLVFDGITYGIATGATQKETEELAAKDAYSKLEKNINKNNV